MTIVVRLIFIVYFLEVGLLLVIAPWSVLWERNYFVQAWPALTALVGNGYVRGAVSGLGLVNLAAAIVEVLGLFRPRPAPPIPPAVAPEP